jgi:hypothetical protein
MVFYSLFYDAGDPHFYGGFGLFVSQSNIVKKNMKKIVISGFEHYHLPLTD